MEKETEKTENKENHNKVILSWKAPEFIAFKKDTRWFIFAGMLTLILLIYAIYTNSATMAIVFIVLAGAYYLTHNQSPKIIEIQITELGVYIGDDYYPYNAINSFWIVYQPPHVKSLYMMMSGKTLTKVIVQLDEQNPVEVRKALAKEIPEVEGGKEGATEILTRLLRL